MNARERARKAAAEANRMFAENPTPNKVETHIADAVSDVWEPIVRDVILTLVFTRGRLEALQISTAEIEQVIKHLRSEVRRG